jgi:hypothetical protein
MPDQRQPYLAMFRCASILGELLERLRWQVGTFQQTQRDLFAEHRVRRDCFEIFRISAENRETLFDIGVGRHRLPGLESSACARFLIGGHEKRGPIRLPTMNPPVARPPPSEPVPAHPAPAR